MASTIEICSAPPAHGWGTLGAVAGQFSGFETKVIPCVEKSILASRVNAGHGEVFFRSVTAGVS